MHRFRLSSVLGAASLMVALAFPATSTLAASSSVECGQVTGYTAPDPLGPTDGSLALGFTAPWTIAAAASLDSAAASVLPAILGTGPTCLSLEFDGGGTITSVNLAAAGHVQGSVTFDVGMGFYILAERLFVPPFITDAVPSLAALFVTSFQAGSDVSITFGIDLSTGLFNAFDGTTEFCGLGSITVDGNGRIGDAVLASETLDAADLAALASSGSRTVCATVHSVGTIAGSGVILGSADVAIVVQGTTVTPPPTDTSTPNDGVAPAAGGWMVLILGALIALVAIVLVVPSPTPRPRG